MEPPITHIKHCGLHWVRYPHDSTPDGWMYKILQWNPGSRTWSYYDQHDTVAATKLDVSDCEYYCAVPDRPKNPYQPNFSIDPVNYRSEDHYQEALARQNMVLNALAEMTALELEGIRHAANCRIHAMEG